MFFYILNKMFIHVTLNAVNEPQMNRISPNAYKSMCKGNLYHHHIISAIPLKIRVYHLQSFTANFCKNGGQIASGVLSQTSSIT